MTDILRPEPLAIPPDLIRIDGNARYRQVEEWLTQGCPVCITDTYGTALTLYGWLKRNVLRRRPVTDYRTSRLLRELLWQLTRPLLVPIAGHRVQLKKAPSIPWLERLYPELDEFLLPLSEVLGLNGSWQWYTRGVRYSVLEAPVHPFHGVHFTTRVEHLELFDAYLARRDTAPELAVDVGTGAGLLTLLLLKHGVSRVQATDTNPNALRSVHDDLARLGLLRRVDLMQVDLVPDGPPVELIVCNPPWLPGGHHVTVDAGSYYPPDFFPRFFAAATRRLSPAGRLVMLFSNLAEIAGVSANHPLADEVESGTRFRLINRMEQPVSVRPTRSGQAWQQALRTRERVQLWELAPR